MNYQFQNRKKNTKKLLPLIVAVVFVGLVVMIVTIAPSFFNRMTFAAGRPMWLGGNLLSSAGGSIRGFFTSHQALVNENNSLKEQLADARIRLLETSVLKHENEALKKTWGRSEDTQGIIATVLSKPPQSLYDTLIIDAGTKQNVSTGDLVVISDTILLGTIDEAFSKTARTKLFSSVGTETTAIIDRNNISLTLIGKGGGSFEVRLPQDVDILAGDIITIPGIKTRLVAEVVDIESTPTDSFKRVFCKTPINISQLRFVSVVKP